MKRTLSNRAAQTSLTLLALLGAHGFIGTRTAEAKVTKPFPGIQLVRDGSRALVVADLCSPGVSVRATKYAERKKTPEQWAKPIGLKAAINADFFDFPAATRVNGRARGNGEDWPTDKQFYEYRVLKEVRGYLQFGPSLAQYVKPSTTKPSSAATQIVGAHNGIIKDGIVIAGNSNDIVIKGSVRRTSIGLSKDRSKLYLFSSDGGMTGVEMANAVLDMSAEANGGKPDVDVATNEDGGGSSQMYVEGLGQIVTSGRLVANHLGVFAKGSGAAPMCPSQTPGGAFEEVDCDFARGWAQDPDEPKRAVRVAVTYGKAYPEINKSVSFGDANIPRPDIAALAADPNHGFIVPTPYSGRDDTEHTLFAVGIDDPGVLHVTLGGVAKMLTCSLTVPKSRKRALSADVVTAWKFSTFVDQLPDVDDTMLAPLEDSGALAATPTLVQSDDGSPNLYVKDGTTRRQVAGTASASYWHFDLEKVTKIPAAELNALTEGPPLRIRPMLAKGKTSGSVVLLDALAEERILPDGTVGIPGEAETPADPSGAAGSSGDDGPPAPADDGCSCSVPGSRGASDRTMFPFATLGLAALVYRVRRSRR